jgi:hypothetical protein
MSKNSSASIKPLTDRERKLIRQSIEITARPANIEDAAYLYKPLCQVALPRSEQKTGCFVRNCGAVHLKVTSDPEIGMPYGAGARLILAYICMRATRYKSKKINMQKSAAALMRLLDFRVSGGVRGSYTAFKSQLLRLISADFEFSFKQKGVEVCCRTKIFKEGARDQVSNGVWCKELEIADSFYESLVVHKNSVPMDIRALIALKESSLALDIYFFLVERLHRIPVNAKRPLTLYWKNLRDQFAHEYADNSGGNKSFKDNFLLALEKVLLMYPAAKVEVVDGGVALWNSSPPIPKKRRW